MKSKDKYLTMFYTGLEAQLKRDHLTDNKNISQLNLFLTGGGGCGKSHLIKTIFQAVSKVLLYHGTNPEKPRVLLLAPTGVASININGTTLHSAFGLPCEGSFYPLNNKTLDSLRTKLSEVQLIIIDEISMVSKKVFYQVHQRMIEIFKVQQPFAGKSLLVCGDLYQLPPVRAFSVYNTSNLITSPLELVATDLWHNMQIVELTEIMRQQGHNEMINMLNKVRTGDIDEHTENLIKSRFIDKNDPTYPVDAIHIYAENAPVLKHNESMLCRLNHPLISIDAIDEIPTSGNVSQGDISAARNRKHTETGGLPLKLDLKIESRVMLTSNVDINDRLINGQMGIVKYFHYDNNNTIKVVYIKFDDENAGRNLSMSNRIGRENGWIPVVQTDTLIKVKHRNVNSPTIRRTQFPLTLSWACTVHKVQGLSLERAVISFDLLKQKSFNAGQMYVALSRVKCMNGLHLTGTYNRNAIKVNTKASDEYERLQKESPFTPNEFIYTTSDNFVFVLLNCRSLKRHASDISSDKEVSGCDAVFLTETQILPDEDVSKMNRDLTGSYNIELNSSPYKFSSLAMLYTNTLKILNHEKHNGVSLIKIKKPSFTDHPMKIVLLYRINGTSIQDFFEKLQQLIDSEIFDCIMGDFNLNALDPEISTVMTRILRDYELVVKDPTHLGGSLLDHVYINKRLFDSNLVKCFVKSVFFSDHDAVKVVITRKI